MLSSFEIVLYLAVLPLLPLVLWSLATGSAVPDNTPLSKYYRVERHLSFVGNLFLLTVIGQAIVRLARHLGWLGNVRDTDFAFWIGLPFLALLLVYAGMWVRAFLKIRRHDKSAG